MTTAAATVISRSDSNTIDVGVMLAVESFISDPIVVVSVASFADFVTVAISVPIVAVTAPAAASTAAAAAAAAAAFASKVPRLAVETSADAICRIQEGS